MNKTTPTAEPTHCDLLIVGGRFLDLTDPSGVGDNQALAIIDNTIAAVGAATEVTANWSAERTVDATNCVVAPGFVDAHVHLSAFLAAARPYERPTQEGTFSGGSNVEAIVPFVAELTSMQLPAELTRTLLRPVFAAMLRSGITSVVDAGSAGHDGLVDAATEAGIRVAIGPSLADVWHDADGRIVPQADTELVLGQTREWLTSLQSRGSSTVHGLVSAVETIACSDALLTGIADLAADFDVATNIHSHITEASDAAHLAEYGRTATERLVDTGFLSPRCTAMHVGNANDNDIAAFVETGVTVNHNPYGNAMFGFHTAHRQAILQMLAAGVPIALGSDYAGSAITTPFESIRAALTMHREATGSDLGLSLEDALQMATNPGASVGLAGQVGELAVGQRADIVIVDTSGPHHLGDRHPVPSLALRARTDDVRTVIVDGRVVVDDRHVTTLDVVEATNDAQQLLASMRS